MSLTRSVAIEHLPETYQRIVLWLDSNMSDEEIASQLDLEPESVQALVIVAQAKLERLLAGPCSVAKPDS